MKKYIVLAAMLCLWFAAYCSRQCHEDGEEGFVSLFNGKDLTGWIGAVDMYGVEKVEVPAADGSGYFESAVLSCFPERKTKDSKVNNLCTEREFGNFILRFDFCMPTNGNNGLGVRMAGPETHASYNAMCELQLLDDGGDAYYDASAGKDKLRPCQYTGSVYGVVPARRDNFDPKTAADCSGGGSYVKKPGKWNSAEVRVVGSRIQMVLNGVVVTDADVSKFKGDGTDTPDGKKHPGLHLKRGRIGWLGHGSHVMWRNIRIKELPDDVTNAKPNLVPNPGFEEVDAQGHLDCYTQPYMPYAAGNALNPAFRRTDFNPHSGRYCAEYSVHNNEGFVATRNRRISLKPGSYYRFSAWLKTDTDPVMGASIHSSPMPGVHVNLFPTLPAGWFGPWPKQGLPILWAGGGESGWRQYVGYFRAHETTREVWVALYVTNVEGRGWFDDLELVEVSESEASGKVVLTDEPNIVTAEDVATTYADGENLIFNGSFEIAANPDMPDFIRYPVGVAWFDPEWKVKRVADASSLHGGHYFHLGGGRDYQSGNLKLQSGRPFTLSFSARSEEEINIKASFSGDPKPRKYVKLTKEWKRYSFPFAAMDKSLERKKHNVFIEHHQGEDFDLDAVCLSYGTNSVFCENRDDGPYVKLAERFARPQASPVAPNEGLALKPMFSAHLDWRRDVLFTDERQTFRAMPDKGEIAIVVTNSQGEVVFEGAADSADLLAAKFYAGPFPEGIYGVRGSSGTFRVVPRRERWCRADRFAHMAETEAGPYIPCATGFSMAERFKSRVPEVARLGFNTLYGWSFGKDGKTARDETYTANFLKNCETNGVSVVMTTPVGLTTTNAFPEILAQISAWQRRWLGAPSIRMWHNYDEVYNWWRRPPYGRKESDIQITKDVFSEADPYRLTWNNSATSGRIFGGNRSTDIASATVYTLRDNLSGAPSTLRAADRLVASGAAAGNNPAITGIWLQFYSGEGEAGSFSHEPSVDEMTLMLYGCLVRGVRAFWLFNMRPRSTILYHETGRLFREIDGLKDILFAGEFLPFTATHEKIVGVTIRYRGKTHVISVNNSYAPVTASVRLPVGHKAGVAVNRFTGTETTFHDFQIRTTWKPCERNVWELR